MASSHKRRLSPALIPNPFVKKRNLLWSLESPSGRSHPSQPASPNSNSSSIEARSPGASSPTPLPPADDKPTDATTADIESGAVGISDHLPYFVSNLSSHVVRTSLEVPRLSVSSYSSLYQSCAGNPQGTHFVIHQHDHPVAGTHYDLRLQINETSSASWAIMYGLPGDPNSIRLNRNATETRIHSLWNHLIETASPETGSLLIWDTGTYSILPRRSKHAPRDDPSSPLGSPHSQSSSPSPQALFKAAFQSRKIRLRLHGTKLPDPYVLNLRLTKHEDIAGRSKSSRKPRNRRRGGTIQKAQGKNAENTTKSSSGSDTENSGRDDEDVVAPIDEATSNTSAMEKELRELEDAEVRLTNAYPGATNTIESFHQRRWYLSLDRKACGFIENKRNGRTLWEAPQLESPHTGADNPYQPPTNRRLSFPFHVLGPGHERSVVTGRSSEEIFRDEGVTNFIQRKGWLPVTK